MRLQSDPTIIYGIVGGKGKLDRPLTRTDIDDADALQHLPHQWPAAGAHRQSRPRRARGGAQSADYGLSLFRRRWHRRPCLRRDAGGAQPQCREVAQDRRQCSGAAAEAEAETPSRPPADAAPMQHASRHRSCQRPAPPEPAAKRQTALPAAAPAAAASPRPTPQAAASTQPPPQPEPLPKRTGAPRHRAAPMPPASQRPRRCRSSRNRQPPAQRR